MSQKTLRLRSYVKSRPKVLEVSKARRFMTTDKEGRESVCTDSSGSEVPSAVVVETPWQVNQGLVKRKAKELYLYHRWEKRQLLELGMPEATLDTWLYKPTVNAMCWKQERDLLDAQIGKALSKALYSSFSQVVKKMTNIAVQSVEQLDIDELRLTKPREFKEWVDAIVKFKKEMDIEEGKPREIKKHVIQTQEEANALLKELQELDPFLDYSPKDQVN